MRSLEEIARAAADSLVQFRDPHPSSTDFGDGNEWAQLYVAGTHVRSDWHTAEQRSALLAAVAAAVLAALREALSPPHEGPAGEAELGRIRGRLDAAVRAESAYPDSPGDDQLLADLGGLSAALDHERRLNALLMRSPEGAIYEEAYRRGFAAGTEVERKRQIDEASQPDW